tara:strand:- start:71 stop:583 length:513 start_codon:yes stop_codon:yes gene_type:complete
MKINLSKHQKKLRNSFLNPFSFSLFFLFNVPMIWLSGIKLKHLDTKKAITKIPFRFIYRWLNKNPFKSIYFAVQCIGAEISTASIVALAIEGHKPSFAYIVTKMRSQYFKKATETTRFTCNDGDKIFSAVNKALKTKEGVEIEAKCTGTLEDGTIVSEFHFTWSIKQRKI